MKKRFRFQDMTIWQKAMTIACKLDELADVLEARKRFRYAEQLRGALLSVSNNISEGSGSESTKDFSNFLRFAKRSCSELANMIIFFRERGYITSDEADAALEEIEHEARMIQAFRKSLKGSED
jgi:four helix bundle protein